MKINKPWLLAGAAGLALALGLYVFSGFLTGPRLPPDWRWDSDFVGIATSPDPRTGTFPRRDTPSRYERRVAVTATARDGTALRVRDAYMVRDPATQRKIYEYIYEADVDPQTGINLNPESGGDYFVFPRNVQPRTYTLRNAYLKGIPAAFQREEEVEGLRTYVFSYKGRGEYTESYAGTADYPGVAVAPGREIRCKDDQFAFRVWVEPVTGEIVKVAESCFSGDYVHDKKSGRALEPVLIWSGDTVGQDVIRRAARIQDERSRILLFTRYLPLALLLLGLGCIAAGLGLRTRRR